MTRKQRQAAKSAKRGSAPRRDNRYEWFAERMGE
jgi:hypothetical protein